MVTSLETSGQERSISHDDDDDDDDDDEEKEEGTG